MQATEGKIGRSHPKTCFVTRLREKAVENSKVDAEGAREAAIARRRTEVRREPFSPTTQIHGLCSQSQAKEVLG